MSWKVMKHYRNGMNKWSFVDTFDSYNFTHVLSIWPFLFSPSPFFFYMPYGANDGQKTKVGSSEGTREGGEDVSKCT